MLNKIITGRLLFSWKYRYSVPYETNTKEKALNISTGRILFVVVTPEAHREET